MDKFIVDWLGVGEINYGSKTKGRRFFKFNRVQHEYRSLHFPRKHGYHYVLSSIWPISVGFIVGVVHMCTSTDNSFKIYNIKMMAAYKSLLLVLFIKLLGYAYEIQYIRYLVIIFVQPCTLVHVISKLFSLYITYMDE